MKMIKLTSALSDITIRVNPNHIISYWYVDEHGVSEVIMTNEKKPLSMKIKETADEIDKLLLEIK